MLFAAARKPPRRRPGSRPAETAATKKPRHAGPQARTPLLPPIPDSTPAPACLRPPSWFTVTTTS